VFGWPVVPAHCKPVPPQEPVVHCAGLAELQPVRPHKRPMFPSGTLKETWAPAAIDQPPFE